MIQLVRKELEAMSPFLWACAALVATGALHVLWDATLVHDGLQAQLSSSATQCATIWVLSFLLGHGSVAHELRDGHVEFLDGLPTTRVAVFAAKGVAGVVVTSLVVASSGVLDVLTHTIVTPPEGAGAMAPTLLMHALMFASGLCGLGVGMFASWFGGLAWAGLGLALTCGVFAGLLFPPTKVWIPVVGTMGSLEWTAAGARHALAPPLVHVALGALAGLVSGGLFLGPGRVLTSAGASGLAVARVGLVGCAVVAGVPLVALFALGIAFGSGGQLWRGTDTLRTEHFRVVYAPGSEARASQIAAEIDDLSEQVRGLLGAPNPVDLDIELMGAPRHHEGVFTGGKIRLSESADLATLAHELAHAYAFDLAGRNAWDHAAHTHFFEEGAADWVLSRVGGGPAVPPEAGAIRALGQARFEELVDSEVHLARHDITQSYFLGRVFAVSLVDVGGPEAVGCVFRALGEVEAGTTAPGLALWYGLAARCDVDLDVVQDRWLALLDESAASLGPLPDLRTRWDDATGGLFVEDARGLGFRLMCGFRDDQDHDPSHWVYVQADDAGRCDVPTRVQVGETFQAQVGFLLPNGSGRGAVMLPWTDVGS